MISEQEVQWIQNLVGGFSEEQLDNLYENLESYLHPKLSMFVPVYKNCDKADSPNHAHPAYSFIYGISLNTGAFILEGNRVEVKKEQSSSIFYFSPGVKHQEVVDEGFSNYIAIFIDKEYFENIYGLYSEEKPKVFKGDYFPKDEDLLFNLKLLMQEMSRNQPCKEQVVNSMIQLITHRLIRISFGQEKFSISQQSSSRIDELIAWLHQNIAEKISLDDMAGKVNMSSSHFTRVFKKLMTKSPVEYLNFLRIEKAKRMLKFSEKNLTEIAFDCGFSSSSYFSHTFIEAVKLTPSEYRKRFTD